MHLSSPKTSSQPFHQQEEQVMASSNINSASYRPTWHLFRRNLNFEILHSSHLKSYTHARKWVYNILFSRLRDSYSKPSEVPIVVKEHFQYFMFCLLVLMRSGETQIKEIENVQSKVSLLLKRSFIIFFFEKEMACGSCLAKHATYVSLL